MKLEDVTVVLRPREPWEAVDLGCSMVRRDFGSLMTLWAATVLPVWLVIIALMHHQAAWFSLVIWWLKPLYDRVPLFFLSKAAFGVRPGFRETWKEWPRLWSRNLFSALVTRRLSLMRSFALPVIMLENQKGKAMRSRISALATDGGGSGSTVTWVFVKLEIAVWLGLVAFTADFVPESISPNWRDLFEFQDAADFVIPPAYYWWLNACYLLAVTLVEPFYVGAGFGLYLNCRTRLEGWDVELAFRRLASRLRGLATIAALVLLLVPGGMHASPAAVSTASRALPPPGKQASRLEKFAADAAQAKEKKAPAPPKETVEANRAADEILKRPEFKVHKRVVKEWRWDSDIDVNPDFNLVKMLAYVLFWGVAAAAIAALVIYLMRNRHLLGLPQLRPKKPDARTGPRVVMGMNIHRDSLPEDIAGTARELWKTHGPHEALSLLYRGTLSRLVERQKLPIRNSDTEDDCLDHVRHAGEPQMTGYFSRLTRTWICEAYAGLTADESEFARLCNDWPFQSAGAHPRHATAAAAALLLMAPFIASCKGHWVDEEKNLGYKGKARTDPFLAAGMLLEENGHKTERTPSLGKLPPARSGLIFTSGEGGVPEGRARQLLNWVNRGGHLVYCVAGAMPYNDWSGGRDFFINFGTDERPDPLLSSLGVKLNDRRPKIDFRGKNKTTATVPPKPGTRQKKDPKPKQDGGKKEKEAERLGDTVTLKRVFWSGTTYEVEVSDKITFTLDRPLLPGEWSATDSKNAAILSLHAGSGRVTLLNHARPLRNKHLGDHDHAAWLVALAGENRGEKKDVRFIVGMTASFWSLLWQHAWLPLMALAVLILLWLWKNSRRFGPVMPVELSETRHFADHISALGQFFFRLRRGDVLLSAAADAVRKQFRQKFPQLANADDEAIVTRLSEQSGLAKERVQAALAAHPPGQNHQLVRLLHDLQLLRQSL